MSVGEGMSKMEAAAKRGLPPWLLWGGSAFGVLASILGVFYVHRAKVEWRDFLTVPADATWLVGTLFAVHWVDRRQGGGERRSWLS